jgi:hypothetical protein
VPLHRKAATPFIRGPEVHILLPIDSTNHLGNTTETETLVDLLDHNFGFSNYHEQGIEWKRSKSINYDRLTEKNRKTGHEEEPLAAIA